METLSPEFDWSEVRDALWRMFSDLGAKEVGRRIGLRNKGVYHIINGERSPSPYTLTHIAVALAEWRPAEYGHLSGYEGAYTLRLVARKEADAQIAERAPNESALVREPCANALRRAGWLGVQTEVKIDVGRIDILARNAAGVVVVVECKIAETPLAYAQAAMYAKCLGATLSVVAFLDEGPTRSCREARQSFGAFAWNVRTSPEAPEWKT